MSFQYYLSEMIDIQRIRNIGNCCLISQRPNFRASCHFLWKFRNINFIMKFSFVRKWVWELLRVCSRQNQSMSIAGAPVNVNCNILLISWINCISSCWWVRSKTNTKFVSNLDKETSNVCQSFSFNFFSFVLIHATPEITRNESWNKVKKELCMSHSKTVY